ncbi:hypothetical protein EVAR_91141_1 [Eumeta japonica]|uniref:Uncharacterized protein n=1 Tax=Eumeta variegata TaxID=151549 RepID=A0A4C2A6V4_EUMVA|nr:hypothetical protein EVAR_91141_1 [Eumeta japonica]
MENLDGPEKLRRSLTCVRSWVFHTLVLKGAGTGRRTYFFCLKPGRLLVGDTTPTVLVVVPLRGVRDICVQSNLISPVLGFGRRCSDHSQEGSAARRPLYIGAMFRRNS